MDKEFKIKVEEIVKLFGKKDSEPELLSENEYNTQVFLKSWTLWNLSKFKLN